MLLHAYKAQSSMSYLTKKEKKYTQTFGAIYSGGKSVCLGCVVKGGGGGGARQGARQVTAGNQKNKDICEVN